MTFSVMILTRLIFLRLVMNWMRCRPDISVLTLSLPTMILTRYFTHLRDLFVFIVLYVLSIISTDIENNNKISVTDTSGKCTLRVEINSFLASNEEPDRD